MHVADNSLSVSRSVDKVRAVAAVDVETAVENQRESVSRSNRSGVEAEKPDRR